MYHVQQRDDASVIEVNGELDARSSQALASAIALAELTFERPIVVSLVACSNCNSTGLQVLVSAKNRLEGRLRVIVPARSRLNRIFNVTGLTKRLSIYANVDEALGPSTPTTLDDVRLSRRRADGRPNKIFGPPPRRPRRGTAGAVETVSHPKAYANIIPIMRALAADGVSLREIAARLDADGHRTLHGDQWRAVQVSRVLSRP